MKNIRFAVIVLCAVLLTPLAAVGAAHLAVRFTHGFYLPALSTIDIPDGFPGQWNKSGVLQTRSPAGVDYPTASPVPGVSGSADAGSTLGSGSAVKLDTCSTGGIGSTCLTLRQVVNILKITGQAAQ